MCISALKYWNHEWIYQGCVGGCHPRVVPPELEAVDSHTRPGNRLGGKVGSSSPLLLSVRLWRESISVCPVWTPAGVTTDETCVSSWDGSKTRVWFWVCTSSSLTVHRHMCGVTHSHWGDCLAHRFAKPSPCPHRSHQLPAMPLRSTEDTFLLSFSSTAAQESVVQHEMHQPCASHKSQTSVERGGTEKPSVKALEKYLYL